MKTRPQLSIDIDLKERLEGLKGHSGRAIANLLDQLPREYLPVLERCCAKTLVNRTENPLKNRR